MEVLDLVMARTLDVSSSSLGLLVVVDKIGDKALSVETSKQIKQDVVELTLAITINDLRGIGMAMTELKVTGDRISVQRILSLIAVRVVVQVASMVVGVQLFFRGSKIWDFGATPISMEVVWVASLVSLKKGIEEATLIMPTAII